MVSSSTTSPNVKKTKSIYQYKFNSIKLSALESNLKELAEEDVSTVSLDEKKDTESTFASTQGSPDNPMNVSLISEMFVKHYAEAKPTCFLKTKVKTFEQHTMLLSQSEIKFVPMDGSPDKVFQLSGTHIKQGLSERDPETQLLLYSMKLALTKNRSCYVYFESKAQRGEQINKLLTALGFASQIEQYEIKEEPIHSNSICSVKLAEHKVTGMVSAIKIINKEAFYQSCEIQKLQEANILAQCRHPNIIKLIEYFSTKKEIFIITEYQEGGDALQYLTKRKQVPESRVRSIARDITEGLKYLHSKGIVHRDIKLENIMLSNESDLGIARIADFGFATRMANEEPI